MEIVANAPAVFELLGFSSPGFKTKKPTGKGELVSQQILMVLEGGLEPPQVALLDP
jgi:hypothetical protein